MVINQSIKKRRETSNENCMNKNLVDEEVVLDDPINKNVNDKLKYLNIDYSVLSLKVREYLYRIESIIIDKTVTQREALELIKNTTFNLNSIADAMKISRTTLYNNKTLEIYIKYSKDIFDQDDPYSILNRLKESKLELVTQIDGFVDRDIESEILKQEISALNKKLVEKDKEIQVLRERRREIANEKKALENDLKQLKRTLETKVEDKVTPLNKNFV